MTHLDVAGGTGDVAFRVLRQLRAMEAAASKNGAPVGGGGGGSGGGGGGGGGSGGGDGGGGGGGGAGCAGFSPGKVIVSDINPWMLGEGQKRAVKLGLMQEGESVNANAQLAGLEFVEGNAECLPFEDSSVDVYTIAFGLRNVTDTLAAGPCTRCLFSA